MTKSSNKEGSILHHHDIDPEHAQECALQFATSELYSVSKTAFRLREIIMKLLQSPGLPSTLSPSVFKAGQTETPELLSHFLRCVISGSEKPQDADSRSERYVHSVANDMIICDNPWECEIAKQMCLGLGLKSILGAER